MGSKIRWTNDECVLHLFDASRLVRKRDMRVSEISCVRDTKRDERETRRCACIARIVENKFEGHVRSWPPSIFSVFVRTIHVGFDIIIRRKIDYVSVFAYGRLLSTSFILRKIPIGVHSILLLFGVTRAVVARRKPVLHGGKFLCKF